MALTPTNDQYHHLIRACPQAEVYHGSSACKRKLAEILRENQLPAGLLPPHDGMLQLAYNRAAGFLWLRQKERKRHYFAVIRRWVAYEPEVMAFVERRRMRKIRGVTTKEFLLTVAADEMVVDDPVDGSVLMTTPLGLSKTFPASAFQLEHQEEEEEEKD